MVSTQFLDCLSISAQALCAGALGKRDVAGATSLLLRTTVLGMGTGVVLGGLVWAMHEPLVGAFTRDQLVRHQVLLTLPLVCAMFPLDALGTIMDGSLIAAKQTDYLGAVQVCGAGQAGAGCLTCALQLHWGVTQMHEKAGVGAAYIDHSSRV